MEYKFLCVLHKPTTDPPHKSTQIRPHSGIYYSKLILILFSHILPSTHLLSSLQAFKKRSEGIFFTGYTGVKLSAHFVLFVLIKLRVIVSGKGEGKVNLEQTTKAQRGSRL